MATAASNNSGLDSIGEIDKILSQISPALFDVLTAVVIVLLGFVLGRIVQKLSAKLLSMLDLDKFASKKLGARFSTENLISTVLAYLIYLFSIVMALNRLHITTTVITTLVIVICVVLILFFLFGMNDIFSNLFAGFAVRLRKNIRVGDYIRIKEKDVEGHIVEMTPLNIRIETGSDEFVFVPNMVVFKSEIIKVKSKSKPENGHRIENKQGTHKASDGQNIHK